MEPAKVSTSSETDTATPGYLAAILSAFNFKSRLWSSFTSPILIWSLTALITCILAIFSLTNALECSVGQTPHRYTLALLTINTTPAKLISSFALLTKSALISRSRFSTLHDNRSENSIISPIGRMPNAVIFFIFCFNSNARCQGFDVHLLLNTALVSTVWLSYKTRISLVCQPYFIR